MSVVVSILLLVTYAMFAAAGAISAVAFGLLDKADAIQAGIGLFAILSLLHLVIGRGRERNAVKRSLELMDGLTDRILTVERTSTKLAAQFAEFEKTIASKIPARHDELARDLRALEKLVQDFNSDLTRTRAPAPAPDLPELKQAAVPPSLEAVREALEQNRVDLHLQPIVSLPQRKLRFYEAFTRLRDSAGRQLMPADYLSVAQPAGLIAVIDNLLLFRCIQVVRRLARRAQGMAIFCNISGHSLRDAKFFPQFVDYMESNPELARLLVFEFGQSELQSCTAQEEACLERLAARGFAFSMDKLTSLDIDFSALGRFNFRFLKVEAKMLIAGMDKAGAPVAANDLKTYARRYGIDLIAEKIEDEKTLLEVLDQDVDFGQGYLFGKPAPLEQILASYDDAAAAAEPRQRISGPR